MNKEYRVLEITQSTNEKAKYIVVSSFSEKDLMKKYGNELAIYKPFILRTPEEQFYFDCYVVDLTEEYGITDQKEKWAICSDLSCELLKEIYPEQLKAFSPCLHLTATQGKAIRAYRKNEEKYNRRMSRADQLKDVADLSDGISLENKVFQETVMKYFMAYLKTLNSINRRRIEQYIFEQKTIIEISKDEGVSKQAASESISKHLKMFKMKFEHGNLETYLKNATIVEKEEERDSNMKHKKIMRGEIYIYDFGRGNGSVQGGKRPAIVLQCNQGNQVSSTSIIAPITTSIKKLNMPCHVLLGFECGLREQSMVLLEQIQTVNQKDLERCVGKVEDADVLRRIDSGLKKLMGM